MWQKNYPIEKYDSVKRHIEDNFEDKYDRPLKESGVKDYEFAEFVKIHSGINAQSVSLDQLKAKTEGGQPRDNIVSDIRGQRRSKRSQHFINRI